MTDDASQNCVFCLIDSGKIPSKKIYENSKCVTVLQLHPANEGHLLLFPKKHYPIMPHIPQEEITHLSVVSKRLSQTLLQTGYGKATTLLIQNGGAAGQTVPHFSINIIPRKKNDLLFKITGKSANENELDNTRLMIIKRLSEMLGRPSISITKKEETPKQIIEVEEKKEIEPKKTVPVTPAQVVQEKIIIKEKECNHILTPPKKYSETKEKVAKIGVKKEDGYLYFVDKEGDISRAKMQRRNKKEEPQKTEENDEEQEEIEEYQPVRVDEKNLLDDISRVLLGR